MSQIDEHAGGYVLSLATRFFGTLDPGALERALETLVGRHEVLQLRVRTQDGVPYQVREPVPSPLLVMRNPRAGDVAWAEEQLARELFAPFDLAHESPLRARLVQLDAGDHVLALSIHHVYADAWSLRLLSRELAELYAAYASGRSPELPETGSYLDAVSRPQSGVDAAGRERGLAYWREKLADLPDLDLPLDGRRPVRASGHGAVHRFTLPAEAAAGLERLCRTSRTTPFMALLALFGAVLHRVSGQTDFGIGTSVANRNREELENVVGLFANVLVLRLDFGGDPTVLELLEQARRTTLEAQAHDEVPLERVVEAVNPPRDLSRNPLYQAMFSLLNPLPTPLELPGLEAERWPFASAGAVVDLALDVERYGDRFECVLTYATDLFRPESIERIANQLGLLVADAAAGPERRVSSLSVLAPSDRAHVLQAWNRTDVPVPETTIHELVAAAAATSPDARAVFGRGPTLDHATLSLQTGLIADELVRRGVRRGDVVAVSMTRVPLLVPALLGILASGAAYVPVDPAFPAARRRFMLADSKSALVLTDVASAADAVEIAEGPCVVAEEVVRASTRRGAAARQDVVVDPDDLAYVMYTSGSQGAPKGVEITHRSLVNLVLDIGRRLRVTADDVWLATTTLSFDVAATEIFVPLVFGGCVAIAAEGCAGDPAAFAAAADELEPTLLQATPTTWRLLMDYGWRARSPIRAISVGEALPSELAHEVTRRGVELWNLYGPTETTIYSTGERVELERPVRIGRPLANTRAYVLDTSLEPVPVGVVGQLCLGGAGVARGYRGRPQLTADRFVSNPFDRRAGGRLYLTGDYVRRSDDGVLEFLGRMDDQVKVRGVRVEIGEVEDQLRRHPGVAAAAVVHSVGRSGDGALVAFVVPTGDPLPAVELRAHLAQRLPTAMVPSRYVVVAQLPTTPNGKLDRRALATAAEAPPDVPAEATTPPSTQLAAALAGVWRDLLGTSAVGGDTDFFDAGGHSLLAARASFQASRVAGRTVPLALLFEHPLLNEWAAAIAELELPEHPLPKLRWRRVRRSRLSFSQERWWILERLGAGSLLYRIPLVMSFGRGPDVQALEDAVTRLVARHDILRTRFPADADGVVAEVGPEERVRLEVLDAPTPEALAEALANATRRPLDLAERPPVHFELVRAADGELSLIAVFHHILCDGWSLSLLRDDLDLLVREPDAAAPAPGLRYADFAEWQRDLLAAGAYDASLAYWRERLAAPPPMLPIGSDVGRRPYTAAGASLEIEIPAELRVRLEALGRANGATLFMTLVAGFQALLLRLYGETDFCVGSIAAGRPDAALADVVGPFETIVPVRSSLAGDPTFVEALRRVRESVVGALTHQHAPVDRLLGAPGVNVAGPYQTMVILHSEGTPAGNAHVSVGVRRTAARSLLTLELVESGDGRLLGEIEYSTDSLERSAVASFRERLVALLVGAVDDPGRRLSRLALPPEGELESRLPRVGHGSTTATRCVHELFELTAERHPQLPAVVSSAGDLAYGDLDRRANRLARHLVDVGAAPRKIVAVYLERSADLVVSLLAVLKAGSVYLPLDVDDPVERTAHVVADAGAAAVISSRGAAAGLSLGARVTTIDLERDADRLQALGGGNLELDVALGETGFLLYTSGSTGTPKGVCVTHRCLANRVLNEPEPLRTSDRCAQKTSCGFIHSLWEILAPLAHGAATVVIPASTVRDPLAFCRVLAEARVTRMLLVPSLLRTLLRSGLDLGEALPDLRTWMVGGEPFPLDLYDEFRESLGDRELLQLYGCSEVFDATYHRADARRGRRLLPIGRPMGNVHVHVVDDRLRPLPAGEVGELVVGGAGVANGYHRRPRETNERFVPDPFAPEGGLLYRTGDLGFVSPTDGLIELVGRADHQVKVRGYRVELSEVEAVLGGHPGVAEVAVVARERDGTNELWAYFTTAPDVEEPGDLRSFAAGSLPSYMIPARFLGLATMPRTASGKLNRQALPAAPGPEAAVEQIEPPDTLEHAVAEIWADAVGVQKVSATDDFFQLGGNSLAAAFAVLRVAEHVGTELPLQLVFDHSELGAFVDRVRMTLAEQPGAQHG
jgi:amino acid adenylation domain-containing protein